MGNGKPVIYHSYEITNGLRMTLQMFRFFIRIVIRINS